ncbi:MAG: hypothetical protein FWD52_08790 [Candidatus Bathyarchaeota archaeon]|nr:hypothetical protein [Candidatus Termiticorpusculum sp.]
MYSCVVEVYDPATDSWSTKADLPVPPFSRNLQAHVADDQIFVRHIAEMYVYDSNNDSWIKKTQIPNIEPRYPIISVVMDDKVICFCVDEHDFPYDRPANVDVVIYDSKTNKWSEGKTQEIGLLEAGAWSGVMAAGATTGIYAPRNIYVLGFKEGQHITWVYDPVKDVWPTAKTMPIMGVYGVAEVDDILYVFGHTANGEVHMQYVPIGYDPRGYQTLPTDTTPVVSKGASSSVSESEPIVVVATVMTACIVVTTLFFYLKRRKRNKGDGRE